MGTLASATSFFPAKAGIQLLAVLTLFLLASNAFAAGRVLFVSGDASLMRGAEIPLIKGVTVEAGDTLVTGDDGRVQLLMDDGDRIAIQPDSRFIIEEFSGPSPEFPGKPVPDASASGWERIYMLAKGGFRTLTRSLGERGESSYQVRTPVATIGVRGTDYTVWLIGPVDGGYSLQGFVSKGEIWLKGPDGVMYHVGEGESFVFDAGGFRKFQNEGRKPSDFDLKNNELEGPAQPIRGTGPEGNVFDFTPGQQPTPTGEPSQPTPGPTQPPPGPSQPPPGPSQDF